MSATTTIRAVAAVAALVGWAKPGQAHVTLEQREAAIASPVKLTFRVPHGCGDKPTKIVRVLIPDGIIAVKPMPKPGWTLDIKRGNYGKSYSFFHGIKLSEGVKEIAWSGTLPDAHYDEFLISAFVSDEFQPNTMLYFPVLQECDGAAHKWIEVPTTTGEEPKEPAPALRLVPKK